ncbi:MAG TPA: hypothetical protein VF099_07455, partial [Ktedonobacterales bacterium]
MASLGSAILAPVGRSRAPAALAYLPDGAATAFGLERLASPGSASLAPVGRAPVLHGGRSRAPAFPGAPAN